MKKCGDIISGAGAIVFSLLSCVLCPLCLPVYIAFLGMIGFECSNLHTFFFPGIAIFSTLSLGFMAYQIHTHHGKWTPFIFALFAVFGMLFSDFCDIDFLKYISLSLFVGSLIWNKRSVTHKKGNTCC